MSKFVVRNLRTSIVNLNKRIDELEAGDLDILKELLSALEFLLEEVGDDPTSAIDKYNEIISFLDLIENTSKLKNLLDDIRNSIPEAPVQSDWAEDDVNDQAYIKNKPTIPTKLSDLQNDAGFAPISGTVDANGYEYVEIAGVKWATKNVGALTETDCGLYFLWGDSLGYTADQCGTGEGQRGFGWQTYKFAYSNSNDSMGNPIINYTKYDDVGLTILDPEDDAATVNMGGSWRMPTNSEVAALFDACNIINADGTVIDRETITSIQWETTLNGMKGLYLEDKTDHTKRIFFPTAGYLEDFPPTTPGKSSYYDAYHPIVYWLKEHGHNGGSSNGFADSFGVRLSSSRKNMACPVRGVLDEPNTLHKVATTGNYNDLNNKPTIPAEQIQSDWNQSDTTAKDYIKNKPTIPTKVSDLTNNSDFLKNPHISNGHEYVEIAGMKWATMNIGATSTTDKGLFFAWGETDGYRYDDNSKSFSISDYKYAESDGSDYVYTKYNDTDQKTLLDLEDDPARVNWGGNWRMPTAEEFNALILACTISIVYDTGVISRETQLTGDLIGFILTDKTDSTKTIFFPETLFKRNGNGPISLSDGVNMCSYWINKVDTSAHKATATSGDYTYTNKTWTGSFGFYHISDFVYAGRAVRPILDEQSTPSNTASKVAVTGDYNDLVNKPIIRVVNLTQNLANETSTISGVENSGKTEVVIYNNTTDESHFVMVSTINKTPTGKLLELIAPVGGYCEVSYINVGGVVFAKGLIVKNDDDNDSLYDNDGDWIVAEFDVDDATTATKIYGGLSSYAYLYGYARLGAIVIDDVTVISKSLRNGPYDGYNRSFVYKFNSEGIHKVKYEVTPGEAGGLFSGCKKLVRINLPSSETLIGREYFSGCTNLKRINSDTDGVFNIPNGVTYIGKDCFNGCNSLTTINIPESVDTISDYYIELSSNGHHGGSVFLNCENLTTINVDSDNTTYDSRNDCNAIIKTENNQLVLGCKNTTIPNTVTSIGVGAFSGCKGMTSFTMPNSIVAIGDRAFEYCDLLEINIPASVKYIEESAFEGCSNLKRINSNTDGVFNVLSLPITIGGVFSDNSHVFQGCSLLDTLNISSTATEEISTSNSSYNTSVSERTTSNCQGTFSKFNHIVVDQNNPIYDSRNNCDAIIRTADNSLVVGCKNTIIPSTVTSIEYYAFNGCPAETITIPGTVTTIKALAFTGASLRSVTIQEGTTTVESGAFNNCNYLTTMSISSTVTSIGPDGLQNLATITVDPNNTVYDSRDNCNAVIETSTNKLIIGASGTVVVPQTVTEIGTGAFAQRQISSITLPNSIVTIGDRAFTTYGSGSRVYRINSDENGVYNLPTGLKTIESFAFYGQESLIELNLPEGITSLGRSCFESCSHLKRVNSNVDGVANIPESVTSINIDMFRYCDGIGKIIFSSIVPPTMTSEITFYKAIYVPTESLEAYKTAAGNMAGYIHPISELED